MLDRLKGQEKAKHILKGFIEKGRIPSSMIFVGREGVGKKTAALYFAMALNCNIEKGVGCGECSSCKRTGSGMHPDVVVISGTQSIGIDEVRRIQRKLCFQPAEGMRNVIIIDNAENLTPPASNALLKTLEEPPSHSVIILITSSPYSLPVTVISRCYRVPFEALSERDIYEILTEIYGIEEGKAKLLSTICDGSVGQAIESEGFISREEVEKILSMFISLRGATIEEIAGHAREFGRRDDLYLNQFFNLARNFLLDGLKYKIECQGYIKYKVFKERIMEFLRDLSTDDILSLIGITGRFQRTLAHHPNKTLLMELYFHEIKGLYLRLRGTDEVI